MNETVSRLANTVPRRGGGVLPFTRDELADENRETVLVQVKVMTADPEVFRRVAADVKRAVLEAKLADRAIAVVVSSEDVNMTAVDVAQIARQVMPHCIRALGLAVPKDLQ